MAMTIGSLFSGIGGLELGLEACGLGPVLWQAEIDPFCRAVLAKHWPDAKRFDDVREVTSATAESADVICGGFPCQDLSAAGRKAGLEGVRSGLWYEFLRVVADMRPRFAFVENIAHRWRAWVPIVRADLAAIGYASMPVRVRASDVGAPHARARVYLLANANCQPAGQSRLRGREGGQAASLPVTHVEPGTMAIPWGWDGAMRTWSPGPAIPRDDHGRSPRVDGRRAREKALGNAVVPQAAREAWLTAMELTGWGRD